MRVSILNEFFYPDVMGGTPKVLSELAEKLSVEHGDIVSVVTSENSYRDPSVKFDAFEDWNGIQIHRVKSPHWTNRRTAQRLFGNILFTRGAAARMLRKVRNDVTLVSTAPVTLPMAAITYGKRRKSPYVYIVYDLDPDRAVALGVAGADSFAVKLLRKHQREWLHGAHRIIAIGRCMRDYLIATYGLPPEKVVVVEVGADAETVKPLPKDSEFRRKHGITGFVVLYSGNFGKYHDFDSVLDAAKIVGKTAKHICFVLVGRGAKKKHLESRIDTENIDNVRMFDFVSDEEYGDLLASADVSLVTLEAGMEGLCVPSKFYSILASGRPTLAVMRPKTEVAYTVMESDLGLWVDLGDSMALAHTVIELSSQPEHLEAQGKNARKVFEENYTTSKVAAKIHNILAEAAAAKS